MTAAREASTKFECFGSTCEVLVSGEAAGRSAAESVAFAQRSMLEWHGRFSRFLPDSELSRVNRDPREQVPVSPLMARFAQAVLEAGAMTRGLVDATLLQEIATAGYASDLPRTLALQEALQLAPVREAAAPSARGRWRELDVNLTSATITRPPGLQLDSGGLAKGLFADVLAETLADHAAFAINCGGDLAIGGGAGVQRSIRVESPFDGRTIHTFELSETGVATSGIGRRSWLDEDGRAAHHLLNPATGKPAYTGVVQVSALAPSALLAEIHAKAAILSGPHLAAAHLPHGGVIVFDDGTHEVLAPPPRITLSDLSALTQRRSSPLAQGV